MTSWSSYSRRRARAASLFAYSFISGVESGGREARTDRVIFDSRQLGALTQALGGVEEPGLGSRDQTNDQCPVKHIQ